VIAAYRLRPKAVQDLEIIADHIAADNPARAVSFIDEMLALCDSIAEAPRRFQRRDDLMKGLRQAVHGHYLILFTADKESVIVERVLHGARRLEDLL
jgi:toxin ParE1/3/4